MNFIAHLYLSGKNEGILVGNFIADAIKGQSQMENFPVEIKRGIILHRKIDSFTDTHPIARASKHLLVPRYNHFSGILIDIFYDHFLTQKWNTYSSEPLNDFSERCQITIEANWDFVPEKMKMFFRYMKRYDRINDYHQLKTITTVLAGMSRRASFVSGMENATEDLKLHFDVLQQHFNLFFPELQAFVKREIEVL